jgi:hypothetical protein
VGVGVGASTVGVGLALVVEAAATDSGAFSGRAEGKTRDAGVAVGCAASTCVAPDVGVSDVTADVVDADCVVAVGWTSGVIAAAWLSVVAVGVGFAGRAAAEAVGIV